MAADPPPTLEVAGLGKKLTSNLVEARRHGVRDIVDELRLATRPPSAALRTSEFWALRDVTFDVAPGEAVGVIGFNGAGKSTLLRLLHGITRPDEGSVTVRGAHTGMLNLAAPFSQLLSGRENVLTAAAIHGVSGEQLDDLVASVVEFSELGEVLDAPMTTYSTGMKLRLGYGIAAHLPSDLLLVDEVIAVGDVGFQRKCLAHIRGHLARGGSLVLVSHDLWMIQALCNRCLVLADGRVEVEGTANHAISAYLRRARTSQVHVPRNHAPGGGEPELSSQATLSVRSWSGPDGEAPRNGDELVVELEAVSPGGPLSATWRLDLLTGNRQVCVGTVRPPADDAVLELGEEPVRFRCVLPRLPLLPGTFYLHAHLHDRESGVEVGTTTPAEMFEVLSRNTRLDTLAQLPGAGAVSSVTTTYRRGAAAPSADVEPAPEVHHDGDGTARDDEPAATGDHPAATGTEEVR